MTDTTARCPACGGAVTLQALTSAGARWACPCGLTVVPASSSAEPSKLSSVPDVVRTGKRPQ